ncbi:MAG TPA: OsmC family protein [candidate division Zixibacteria bacterium]|nr:OsmC family protein [candidate division Zixibacteria bacterium]
MVDGAEGNSGPRPAELLVAALAGCTAMDVISILRKKRQVVEDYAVRVQGVQRTEHPAAFTDFEILHHIRGPVDPEAVRRAIELSATRYCSVGATLSSGLPQLRHSFQVERPDGLVMAEVCKAGPYRSMGSIGEPVPA